MFSLSGLLLITWLASSSATQFCMEPCRRDNVNLNGCSLTMFRDAMRFFFADQSMPLSNMKFNYKRGDVILLLQGKEMTWEGLETWRVKNFQLDLDNMKLSFGLDYPSMTWDGTCVVTGHVGNVGIYADGEHFPYSIIHSVTVGFSANFIFNLELNTNTSGTFLTPVLTAYDPHLGTGTFTLEKMFPPGITDDEVLKEVENGFADATRKLQSQLISQMIPALLSKVFSSATYDQFFPETATPTSQLDAICVNGALALTVSWLPVILSATAAALLNRYTQLLC